MAKRRITPEERADWAEVRRRLGERIEYYEELRREERDRDVRRRERLQRLTLGLLGR